MNFKKNGTAKIPCNLATSVSAPQVSADGHTNLKTFKQGSKMENNHFSLDKINLVRKSVEKSVDNVGRKLTPIFRTKEVTTIYGGYELANVIFEIIAKRDTETKALYVLTDPDGVSREVVRDLRETWHDETPNLRVIHVHDRPGLLERQMAIFTALDLLQPDVLVIDDISKVITPNYVSGFVEILKNGYDTAVIAVVPPRPDNRLLLTRLRRYGDKYIKFVDDVKGDGRMMSNDSKKA